MFDIGPIKGFLKNAGNRLSGRTDLLEGCCAAAAYVAAADGTIDEDEIETAVLAVVNHPVLNEAFDSATIESTMTTMIGRANGGMAGKASLLKEVSDCKGKADATFVLAIAADVAAADGNTDEAEEKAIEKIGTRLGVSLADV